MKGYNITVDQATDTCTIVGSNMRELRSGALWRPPLITKFDKLYAISVCWQRSTTVWWWCWIIDKNCPSSGPDPFGEDAVNKVEYEGAHSKYQPSPKNPSSIKLVVKKNIYSPRFFSHCATVQAWIVNAWIKSIPSPASFRTLFIFRCLWMSGTLANAASDTTVRCSFAPEHPPDWSMHSTNWVGAKCFSHWLLTRSAMLVSLIVSTFRATAPRSLLSIGIYY